MIKAGNTRRKFYGKWLYKITVWIPGVSIFRSKSMPDILMFCISDKLEEEYSSYSTLDKAYLNKKSILQVAELLNQWDENSWTKRIETNTMDIYVNSQEKYQEGCEKLNTLIKQRFEPDPLYLKDLGISTNIVVKRYPHKIYKHKVYLKPHRLPLDNVTRNQYLEWVESQNPRILITEAVKKWFMTSRWNWDRRYILVEDQQTLLMLKLRNSDAVGKIYNYVLADK